MKTSLPYFIFAILIGIVNAGPIKQMATDDPDQILEIISTATYDDLLQLVNSAYAESKAENDEPLTQYVYMIALDRSAPDLQIQLAVDFSLVKSDFDLKQLGARAIRRAMLQGASPDAALRQQVVLKLKNEVQALNAPSRDAYEFATQARDALVVLGEDAGLDLFLTGNDVTNNYKQKNGWNSNSDASVFDALKMQYEQAAAQPGNENPDADRIMAAIYELCRLRRTEGKEIKPLQPIANLDNLLPK